MSNEQLEFRATLLSSLMVDAIVDAINFQMKTIQLNRLSFLAFLLISTCQFSKL